MPRHRPYRTAAALFEIGLRPMEIERWLDVGADHAAFMSAKRQRLKGRPPLFYGSIPRSLAAQSELLRAAAASLLANHADVFRAEGGHILDLMDGSRHALEGGDCEPLETLGGMLEEDFVLFEKEEGRDIVTAVSNAYTSSGRIVSCVGRNMRFAHEPVPGLNETLGDRIDRVIGNVQPGKPVVRFNWFVTGVADRLFPPPASEGFRGRAEGVIAALAEDFGRAGEILWLRVERQTFLRLPETGALAFGIHTYSDPLSMIENDGESLAALHRLLGEYSVERLRYSGMLELRDAVRRWAEARLG